jgi:hypothetical protein
MLIDVSYFHPRWGESCVVEEWHTKGGSSHQWKSVSEEQRGGRVIQQGRGAESYQDWDEHVKKIDRVDVPPVFYRVKEVFDWRIFVIRSWGRERERETERARKEKSQN